MRTAIIIQPVTEPVSVADVKLYTRIPHNEEDSLLLSWIKTGRMLAEDYIRAALITQTVECSFDCFPNGVFNLPRSPIQSVDSILYFTSENVETEYNSTKYSIDLSGRPGRIYLNKYETWPTDILRPIDAVKIRYVAGFGDNASDVPSQIRDAILLYCSHKYNDRQGEKIPNAFFDLLAPYSMPVMD